MYACLAQSSKGVQCVQRRSLRTNPNVAPRAVICRGVGKDVVDGWFDMAKLVSGSVGTKSAYDELATTIGKDVYVDLQGWHVYLKDLSAAPNVKMHALLASQIGPQARGMRESDIEELLKKVPIKLGAGKVKVSLFDIMPSMCVADMARAVEEYARR